MRVFEPSPLSAWVGGNDAKSGTRSVSHFRHDFSTPDLFGRNRDVTDHFSGMTVMPTWDNGINLGYFTSHRIKARRHPHQIHATTLIAHNSHRVYAFTESFRAPKMMSRGKRKMEKCSPHNYDGRDHTSPTRAKMYNLGIIIWRLTMKAGAMGLPTE